ncbi:hypothetical protein GCM10011574_58540 [Microbispora bryophytorum]|uniref:Uncharacterized protein n=1 Tax=Microbispora bryophytorum TaxID=1460882 RepID=A0A8H9H6S7_9ACTN|nr:hypothetical protein GCM10011574_58540 [Microbispora bryophytorum]
MTVAIIVGVYAARGRSPVSASATATMAWMFLTGFLVNDAGTLTFSPADRVRLGILLATGVSAVRWAMLQSLCHITESPGCPAPRRPATATCLLGRRDLRPAA